MSRKRVVCLCLCMALAIAVWLPLVRCFTKEKSTVVHFPPTTFRFPQEVLDSIPKE